ncbi:hypothetical protein BJF92_17810 [Rhizobium rhizosphaerae]|uniref:Cellulose biosynthesis protein BcsN n=1 Tax=Xaviernesmea rhizosphaerae TaxID=1672749 RepID=A0A1Q9ADB0_9HYPH|nr:cellulose biosynthesis protein BcsN [Xaviernesmea rhizosphaerae]OLP52908.1 hypothetical protein BJF92_17810 [Xaviernesmea rhizosphaerae]
MATTASLRHAMIAMVLLCLPACGTPGGLKMNAMPAEVPVEKAMAFPPPGGPAIVSVVERNYSNAVAQDILLETNTRTPGENYIKVQFYGPGASAFERADRLSLSGFTTDTMARDIRAQFPTMRMRMASTYQQNGYGAFGYAYGSSGGESCLYAWQQITSSEHGRNGVNDLGMIRTRLRLCDRGSIESLLAVMYHYTLSGGFEHPQWNPYGPAPKPDPRIGMVGKPIYSLPPAGARTRAAAPRPATALAARAQPSLENAAAIPQLPSAATGSAAFAPSAQTPAVFIPAPNLPAPADVNAEARTVGIPRATAMPAAAAAPAIPAAPVIPAP